MVPAQSTFMKIRATRVTLSRPWRRNSWSGRSPSRTRRATMFRQHHRTRDLEIALAALYEYRARRGTGQQ